MKLPVLTDAIVTIKQFGDPPGRAALVTPQPSRGRFRFRGKLFLALIGVATAGLLVSAVIARRDLVRESRSAVERDLLAHARLAAAALQRLPPDSSDATLDEEVDRLGGTGLRG